MLKITDKQFVYTPSFETDLKKKFRKIVAENRKLEEQKQAQTKVVPIAAKKSK